MEKRNAKRIFPKRCRVSKRQLDKWREQIAEELNREGRRTARGGQYTGGRVRSLCVRLGLTAVPAGVANTADMPGKNEWWLPELAASLKVKPIVMHRWRWSGWVQARQLPGENGRWIVWADGTERRRLRQPAREGGIEVCRKALAVE